MFVTYLVICKYSVPATEPVVKQEGFEPEKFLNIEKIVKEVRIYCFWTIWCKNW